MIIGDPSRFALESEITKAYERPSLLALGYFVIHVKGECYGIVSADASMLASSFDEVSRRLRARGDHQLPLRSNVEARLLADAVSHALYDDDERDSLLGICRAELSEMLYSKHLLWAPDGDEAFDDGSHILQIDSGNTVRLIAFKRSELTDSISSLRELLLEANEFYEILAIWLEHFHQAWQSLVTQ